MLMHVSCHQVTIQKEKKIPAHHGIQTRICATIRKQEKSIHAEQAIQENEPSHLLGSNHTSVLYIQRVKHVGNTKI